MLSLVVVLTEKRLLPEYQLFLMLEIVTPIDEGTTPPNVIFMMDVELCAQEAMVSPEVEVVHAGEEGIEIEVGKVRRMVSPG